MKALITGGCGFIGSNTAMQLAAAGWDVTLFDNLSRKGAEQNLEWIRQGHAVHFIRGDVRDRDALESALARGRFHAAIHLAAQVAVTTSVDHPRHDFEVNALGTFNLLEAARLRSPSTIILNASTNKVYGKLQSGTPRELATRYECGVGVPETQPLDFYSPYGCSKGSADQYVSDYARIYNLRTVNLRQSCIYGPRQFGVEDQGWVAWFAIAHTLGRPVTIFGTGKQVRDLLHVRDLVGCYQRAIERIDTVAGRSFNIGGGPANTLSLLELLNLLRRFSGRAVTYDFGECRPGDQPVYISDVRRAEQLLDWKPTISVEEGVRDLWNWIHENSRLFAPAEMVAV